MLVGVAIVRTCTVLHGDAFDALLTGRCKLLHKRCRTKPTCTAWAGLDGANFRETSFLLSFVAFMLMRLAAHAFRRASPLFPSARQQALTVSLADVAMEGLRGKDLHGRVIAAAVLPNTERESGGSGGGEREHIPDGFLISAFGQDLIPSLSSSPLLVKPSTYHTGFLILSGDPVPPSPLPRQQH